MYVESRKMAQMNLFAGQEEKHNREYMCGHEVAGTGSRMNWAIGIDTNTLSILHMVVY